MHARGVVPDEKRFVCLDRVVDETLGFDQDFSIQRPLAFTSEGAFVFDLLRAVRIRPRVNDAALREELRDLGCFRKIILLRVLAGVEVIENAKELIKTVRGGQVLIAVAQVILAKLAGGVAERLKQVRQRGVQLRQALFAAGYADGGQTHADRILSRDKRRASRSAGGLGVVIHEDHPFLADAVDVRRAAAHHAAMVGTDIPDADVVAPNDQDVGLARFLHFELLFRWLMAS